MVIIPLFLVTTAYLRSSKNMTLSSMCIPRKDWVRKQIRLPNYVFHKLTLTINTFATNKFALSYTCHDTNIGICQNYVIFSINFIANLIFLVGLMIAAISKKVPPPLLDQSMICDASVLLLGLLGVNGQGGVGGEEGSLEQSIPGT